jgi:uncharacterized membrane protein
LKIFPWKKASSFFSPEDRELIIQAVRDAERRTSGEIRVFIEKHCAYMDAIDQAAEIFFRLQMQKTEDRNAVLLYVAIKDRQLAVFGDEGIHQRVGNEYWNREVKMMIESFNRENYADGIRKCVLDIGQALHQHFPYDNDTDKNELPDDIVFGN